MDATPEKEPRHETHRLRILPWLTGLFIAIALYVISSGPMAYLEWHDKLPEPEIMVIYRPLEILSDHSETVARFFRGYVRLWVRRLPHGTPIPGPAPAKPE